MPVFDNNFNEKLLSLLLSSLHQKCFCPSQPKLLVKMWNNQNSHTLLQPTLEKRLGASTKAKHVSTL